jgi:hypothetical protein
MTMTFEALIDCFVTRGFRVHVLADGRIRVRSSSALTEDIRDAIRRHKREVIEFLRSAPAHAGAQPADTGGAAAPVARPSGDGTLRTGDAGFEEAVTLVLGMRLDEFEQRGQPIEVKVPWLDATLWWVPDERHAEALVAEGVSRGRVWTATELLDLMSVDGLTPEHVRAVALAKAEFAGDVVAVTPVASRGTR